MTVLRLLAIGLAVQIVLVAAMWWPGEKHSVSAAQNARPRDIVLEPRPGGAVYEITCDGQRADWGTLDLWQPPHHLAMTWHPGKTPDQATRLRLDFAPAADGTTDGTLVTLTHSGWEALGNKADDLRTHYNTGWDHVFGDCYESATKSMSADEP